MPKNFVKVSLSRRVRLPLMMFALAALISSSVMAHAATCSSTADCQQQINSLSNQNANNQQSLSQLAQQAQGYQGALDALNSQIATLQSQISANQSQQASLQQQITDDQNKINQEKGLLGDVVKSMYVDGQLTTIEELATSKNLSDYVDQEENRTNVQDKLNDLIKQISALQVQLQSEKQQVDTLLVNEKSQNDQLAAAQQQQQQLLSYNQSQQSNYDQQIASANSNISQLKARLAALNTVTGQSISVRGTCGGGYPAAATSRYGNWGCNYAQDNTFDNWGMYNRECVSYTAYMVATKYGISTAGYGNAYQWIASAEHAGYRVDQTPSVGAIAIRNIDFNEPGDVGHAMYVAGVSGSNITVQEYNESFNGTYDQRTFNPDTYDSRGGMYYIHFGG